MQNFKKYENLDDTGDMGYYIQTLDSLNLPSGMGGDYQASCYGCSMSGTTLSCMCYDGNGVPRNTSISNVNYNSYITNCDGNLETISNTSGLPSGNGGGYQKSCSGCTYGDACFKHVLSCSSCKNSHGGSQASAISDVNNNSVISYCDGHLRNGHC